MSKKLIVELVVINLIFIIFIYNTVKKNKLSLKYALFWVFSSILMIISALNSTIMYKLARFLGIETASNMVFLFIIGILIIISFIHTTIVSKHKEKINVLVEEIGILKEKIESDKSN